MDEAKKKSILDNDYERRKKFDEELKIREAKRDEDQKKFNEQFDYKKLLGISVSPRDNMDEFIIQLKEKLEKTNTIKQKKYYISLTFKIVHNEESFQGLPRLLCEQKLDKIKDFYRSKMIMEEAPKLDWNYEYCSDGSIRKHEEEEVKVEINSKSKNENEFVSGLKWKGTKRELLELIYALIYSDLIEGQTDNKNWQAFSHFFNFELKGVNSELNQMAGRGSEINEEITPFFQKLNKGWKTYNVRKMNKLNKRQNK
jgi:hypothetical protein